VLLRRVPGAAARVGVGGQQPVSVALRQAVSLLPHGWRCAAPGAALACLPGARGARAAQPAQQQPWHRLGPRAQG
jgi:hypothetical protein